MSNRIALSLIGAYSALLCFCYLQDLPRVFPLDDAYIHFVYAKNLAAGHGFCFNVGERSFGTSSPLWTALLALAALAGAPLREAALLLSLACYAGTAFLAYRICLASLPDTCPPAAAFAAPLLYLACGNETWLAFSGMETALFHFLCLAAIDCWLRRGFDTLTAAVAAAVVLCRITGLLLPAVLLAAELVRSRRLPRALRLTACLAGPWFLYHYSATGAWFPVTGRGKLLTYVDGGWDPDRIIMFCTAVARYLAAYEPVYAVLALLTAAAALIAAARGKPAALGAGMWVTGSWALLHAAAHIMFFRSICQQARYLSALYPALAVCGACALAACRPRKLCVAATLALVLVCSGGQPFWLRLYRTNVHHINSVYFRCARWIADNTRDTTIAAFDIGILKYCTGRSVVDLGGVTDPAAHPYLRAHTAGNFLRAKGATLIMHSRLPDCDVWPGVYRARFDRSLLLQESLLKTFEAPLYPAPAITHSFRLDVGRIAGWLPDTSDSYKKIFFRDALPDGLTTLKDIGHGLSVGCVPDRTVLPIVKHMAQYMTLSYYWTRQGTFAATPFVRTTFVNRATQQIIFDKVHIPTHNLLPPAEWPTGQIVSATHVVWLDDSAPPGVYDIFVRASEADTVPPAGQPATAASDTVSGNAHRPIAANSIRTNEFILEKTPLEILY